MQSLLEYNAQLESYKYIFYFSLLVGLIFAILTILLCIFFKVDEVFGDVTGAYRRKAIKKQKDEAASGVVGRNRNLSQHSARNYADNRSKELALTEEMTAKFQDNASMDETVPLATSLGDSEETLELSGNGDDVQNEETVVLVNKEVFLDEDIVVSSSNKFL